MEHIYNPAQDPFYAPYLDLRQVKDSIGGAGGSGGDGPKANVIGHAFGDFEVGAGGLRFGAVREAVKQANEGGLGPISQNPATDTVPGDNTTTEVLAIGGATETGYINTNGDQDWYKVTLEAGKYYEFTMDPSGSLDAVLQIRGSNGAILATADGPGASDTEVVGFYASTSGTYYVNADGFSSTTGQYTLSAREAPLPDILDSIDWGGATVANPEVIHVYFAQQGEVYDGVTSLGWNSYEIGQAMAAFGVYEDIINVTYVQTTNAAEADFKLVTTNSNQYLGYFNPPGTDNAGVGVFARNGTGWDENGAGGLEQGGYGWITMIHEFGHGMGLAHPHDNGGGSAVMLGVTDAFDSYGLFNLNQGVWTTMSYNDGWSTGPNGNSPSTLYGYQGTMMALDIALLQEKYGANTSFNTGNNTYVMDTANAAGTYYEAIWDAGGNDTISFAGSANAVIDLRPATIDYSASGGGYMSYATGIYGGFTIARGVVIENAIGGSGNDTINGNDAANNIQGGGGNDTIMGGKGADTIDGGSGNDVFKFAAGDGADTINGFVAGGSDDRIEVTGFTTYTAFQEGANLRLVFDANNSILLTNVSAANFTAADINITGTIGNGEIDGTPNADTLNGTSNADTINGLGGDDTLNGAGGNDTLNGGDGNDTLNGGDGNDTLNGGAGSDTASFAGASAGVTANLATGANTAGDTMSSIENLTGSSFADTLTGDSAANVINGGDGNDTINGAGGDDTLNGGAGNDVFLFAAGDGADTINGFTAGGTDDRIEVTGFSTYTKVQEGANLRIVFDANNSILLTNVTAAAFTSADINIPLAPNVVNGTESGETLNGTAEVDIISGLGGNDILNGLAGSDTLDGGEGNDRLVGGLGDDTLTGGNGTDQVDYRNSATAVTVNLTTGVATGEGSDTLSSIENVQGSAFGDSLTGNAGANNLNGHGGDDTLSGGLGNDTLIGGAGADAMDGGSGLDYASYISATAGVSINLLTNTHTGDAAGDTFANIERFRLSAFADTFQGGAGTNYAYGAEGDDTLRGGAGFDRLYGEEGSDQLFGEADNDVLVGGAGADALDGGAGKDGASYETSSAAVSIDLSSGVHTGDAAGDTFSSIEFFLLSGQNDTFVGGTGADEAQGGAGADSLSGGDGADWMRGQAGDDTLNGGIGDDTLEGGAGADAMDGGAGTDYASYTAAAGINLATGVHTGEAAGDTFTSIERFRLSGFDDSFFGSAGNDWVAGYMGNDTLNGADGNDTLNGGGSSDTLIGGAGDDKLIGEAGNDTLTGGTGADAFQFTAALFGNDTITDFGVGADYIRVTGIAGVDDFSDLTVTQNGANTLITFPDGSTITLTGVTAATIDASDFSFG